MYNFVMHGLFIKDDSFKKGSSITPFSPTQSHVLVINKLFKKRLCILRQHKTKFIWSVFRPKIYFEIYIFNESSSITINSFQFKK